MIIKLMYQDKELTPYVTRVTSKKPPKTIIYNNVVFQNLNIVYIKNSPVYQYREIEAIDISTIELNSINMKFKPELNELIQEKEQITTINTPNIKNFTAEIQKLKKARTTVNIEITLISVFAIVAQSQIIYKQEKVRNIKVANAALETGLALQTMFKTDSEIYKMLQINWKRSKPEIRKMLEITQL